MPLQKTSMHNQPNKLRIAFFGTPRFAVIILEQLEKAGLLPSLIVTNPDQPKGRGLEIAPPPVKVWAQAHNIPFIQPATLKDHTIISELRKERWDIFIVAAYGKILPKDIIDLPLHNTLNVHPSLLPKFRGPSPIHGAMLADEKVTGVSIMKLDEEMDHGPVLAQETYTVAEWPVMSELENILAEKGGALLAQTIPKWIERNVPSAEQEHHLATYTKKVTKNDGLIDLKADGYLNFRKYQAYENWPGTFFFAPKRIIIKKASYKDGKFIIERIVPEGEKECDYNSYPLVI